jgi:8-oxo-dGTP pyrophosphatase MutT (NUDIX family)
MREVCEETGLEVRPVRFVGVYSGHDYFLTYPNGDEVAYTNYCFDCRITGGHLLTSNDESAALRFVAPDNLPQVFDSNHAKLIDHTYHRSDTYFEQPGS